MLLKDFKREQAINARLLQSLKNEKKLLKMHVKLYSAYFHCFFLFNMNFILKEYFYFEALH